GLGGRLMEFLCQEFLRVAAGAVALIVQVNAAVAQDYPLRPVTIVVPFAAGGVVDVVARVVSGRLAGLLGRAVNAGYVVCLCGMTAVLRVVKAAPDGYQVVLGTAAALAINQTLYKKPLYDAAIDLAPVGLIAEQPQMLTVRKDLPAGTLQEFVIYTKRNQARMQYGSSGAGSVSHLACALLNVAICVNVTHVPYRGGGNVAQDLIAGRLDYWCGSPTTALPLVESNALKAVAILAQARLWALPALATASEQGLSGVEADNWFAFFLPKAAPLS